LSEKIATALTLSLCLPTNFVSLVSLLKYIIVLSLDPDIIKLSLFEIATQKTQD
jgi:hypothetical protein